MGIPDQAGDVAKSAISGMSGNPLCLAVVILVAILGVTTYFVRKDQNEKEHDQFTQMLNKCWAQLDRHDDGHHPNYPKVHREE